MKITTWNVNGFRAIVQKDFHKSVEFLDPDVLCLQEIKAKVEQVPDEKRKINGYAEFWNPAERPGYSGVASYIRGSQPAIEYGLGHSDFDNEGRVIQMDYGKFALFNIYFPNGQRGQERVDYKLAFYDELLRLCNEMRKENKWVILTGDFNTAHKEIDLANPKENETTSGFLPEERAKIDVYLNNHLNDVYRMLYPDRVQYTWWTYRVNARARGIGWRLDYYLVSDELVPAVKDVIIYNEIKGSDHCPVTMILDETKIP
jgi:exodeoxyribonuclease-3